MPMHGWSIALYKQQVENILEGLCRIDPKHQDAYESNAKGVPGKA